MAANLGWRTDLSDPVVDIARTQAALIHLLGLSLFAHRRDGTLPDAELREAFRFLEEKSQDSASTLSILASLQKSIRL